jgi:phenylpyruvate tautomerase PptA (4-oxalocrotonate tautomerase family)
MPTVIVYWSPGRSQEQKQRVSQRIYEALVDDGGARPEDVLVIFQNIEAGDAARPGAVRPGTAHTNGSEDTP